MRGRILFCEGACFPSAIFLALVFDSASTESHKSDTRRRRGAGAGIRTVTRLVLQRLGPAAVQEGLLARAATVRKMTQTRKPAESRSLNNSRSLARHRSSTVFMRSWVQSRQAG